MKLHRYYADLHIHVGYSRHTGPVKITASRRLTLPAILAECTDRKGIGVAGVVDCVTAGVRRDLVELLAAGELEAVNGGGYLYRDRLMLIPAAEVEAVETHGGTSHWIGYYPDIDKLGEFAAYLETTVTNMNLSSQRSYRSALEIVQAIHETGGEPVPAHAFTPHKGVYGNATDSLEDLLGDQCEHVLALELGLSADTALADLISENHRLNYLSNSDAHSAQKIGREHNELLIASLAYQEVMRAVRRERGRRITANYGLDPRLGKYHRTFCLDCERPVAGPPPVYLCPNCGSERVVVGVLDRITSLAAASDDGKLEPARRPPYVYQVPLEFVPGVGPKTLDRLIKAFGSELTVLHVATKDELAEVVGQKTARLIAAARTNQLQLEAGGGGYYGRVRSE